MKRILLLASLIISVSISGWSQDDNAIQVKKPSRDFVMVQLTYEGWLNAPENVKIGGFGRGVNAYLCYDFPIGKSNFSFAPGIGVSSSNIYFKNQKVLMNVNNEGIVFEDVPEGNKTLKSMKLNTTYLEAPFELRFFSNKENRNKGFKAAIGMKVGMLIGAHTKEKHTELGPSIIEKVNSKRFVESWRFAPLVRLGYGNFTIFGSANISKLFNDGQGPEVFPYSIGLSISGL